MTRKIRVSSGVAKNIQLSIPSNPEYKGVQEVAKQALFNIIGDDIVGTDCLDLYAGSGAIGIEALSRGAEYCDFVDEDKNAVKTINDNLSKTGFIEKATVFRDHAVKYVVNTPEKYDYIFIDPYYKDTSHVYLFKNLEEILNPSGIIAFFHGKELNLEETLKDSQLSVTTQRKFGKTYLTLISHLTP